MSQPLASFQMGSSTQDLLGTVFHSIPKVLVFLFILIIGWFVATASIVLVALGAIAALKQLGVAATVTQPVLYTVLLTCGAITAIGVGGGLIKPMQARWERMLANAEPEASGQPAVQDVGQPAVRQPAYAGRPDQQRDQQPPGYVTGPRCLQRQGFSRGAGYPHNPGYSPGPGHQEDPGLSTEMVIQDDPEHYPGGQYM